MYKKTKVIFITNNFMIGGVERLLFDLIYYLDKDKYDIQIVTILGYGPLESSFRNLGVPIYFAGFPWFSHKKLPFKLYWFLIAPFTLVRIIFFIFKNKPDVVISSFFQADIIGMTASKIVGVKKRILIQHDIVKFGKLACFAKKMFALKFATQIVSISGTVKNFLIEYFEVKNEKIKTIYNGINYENFEKGRKLISDFNYPVVGIIGRLEVVKGHIYALEALNIIKEKYQLLPVTLLAGDGSLRNDLERYTTENNIGNIKFLGNISDVPSFLSQIDILIVPSISEGFGLALVEGMVSGKIIIASNIPVMHELIKDGETGLLFESENSLSLASILLNVLKDKELCKKLQENTLLYAEKNRKFFDIKEVSKSYQNLISE